VLDARSGELTASSFLCTGARGPAVLCGMGGRRFSATTGNWPLGAGGGGVRKGLRGDEGGVRRE